MLNEEARANLQYIQDSILQIWGQDCELRYPQIMASPYPEFELSLVLYGKIEVGIYYDRSALDIGIKKNGKYELLSHFTDKPVIRGMKAMRPENLRYDLTILEEVIRGMVFDS